MTTFGAIYFIYQQAVSKWKKWCNWNWTLFLERKRDCLLGFKHQL